MATEPECKCYSPSYHGKDCAYIAWVKAGKPEVKPDISVPAVQSSITFAPGIVTMSPINCLYIRADDELGALDPGYMGALKSSLMASGLFYPLYVTTGGRILHGRKRWKLLIELGHTEVAVKVEKR